ncbi:MAG: hypothetical protein U5K69_04665 [Balneolaceae bacterium]|nr:hypothetical protein [Balneolaceae bacterium]
MKHRGWNLPWPCGPNEALSILSNHKFAAIITDMGRSEGRKEGLVLLEKLRQAGDKTPFFIYASSNALEHKREALQRGAQGSTNRAEELYEMVMDLVAQ